MKARLLYRQRIDFDDGDILEIVVWEVPTPLTGSQHPYKYRLFFGRAGVRILGYDNEQPKGDHVHRGAHEFAYPFVNPEQLIDDFLNEVSHLRSQR